MQSTPAEASSNYQRPQTVIDFQLAISQQANAKQGELGFAFNDFDHSLIAEPVDHATKRLEHDLSSVGQPGRIADD